MYYAIVRLRLMNQQLEGVDATAGCATKDAVCGARDMNLTLGKHDSLVQWSVRVVFGEIMNALDLDWICDMDGIWNRFGQYMVLNGFEMDWN